MSNPIDQVVSYYNMKVRHGYEKRSLEEAFTKEIETLKTATESDLVSGIHWQAFNYVSVGLYVYKLRKWLETFPREQLLILRSEDLFERTELTVDRVFDFLELPAYKLREYPQHNAASYSSIDDSMRQMLTEYFQPHNQKLEEESGIKFDWE
jgi:hypothetical protein